MCSTVRRAGSPFKRTQKKACLVETSFMQRARVRWGARNRWSPTYTQTCSNHEDSFARIFEEKYFQLLGSCHPIIPASCPLQKMGPEGGENLFSKISFLGESSPTKVGICHLWRWRLQRNPKVFPSPFSFSTRQPTDSFSGKRCRNCFANWTSAQYSRCKQLCPTFLPLTLHRPMPREPRRGESERERPWSSLPSPPPSGPIGLGGGKGTNMCGVGKEADRRGCDRR